MRNVRSWWTAVFAVGALASSTHLLDGLWDRLGFDVLLAVAGIGLVCLIRGVLGLLRRGDPGR